jgi:hypothetical protein
VVTGNIVEPDSIIVKVVEYGQTKFISLTVVRLWNSKSAKKY